MLYLGLSLSHSLLGTPLPGSVIGWIERYPELAGLESFVLESWQEEKSTFAKTAAMLKLFPGIRERILYLHKIVLKPSFNEYWYIDLPKGMYWAYYLIRPYLLIKKYPPSTNHASPLTLHPSRLTNHESRITIHASRTTSSMIPNILSASPFLSKSWASAAHPFCSAL